jgi:tetratricopeptide (TPR) repeat protein
MMAGHGQLRYSHPAMRNLIIVVLGVLAGCAGMTCDSNRKESILRMNQGVDFAKAKAFGQAEKELEAATTLHPENHQAAFALGQVYADQKKWEKAIDAFSLAAKHNSGDAMYHYRLGQAYYESGKLEPARKELDRSLSLNERLYKAHWYLGRIHEAEGRHKEAAAAWTEACRLNPGFGKPFIDLGRLYYDWDFLQEAVSVLGQGAQYARDDDDLTNIYYYLGMAYDGLKQYDKAVEAYLSSIRSGKGNVEARLQAGMAYANKGDRDNAKKYLAEFVKMGGGNNAFAIQAANDRLAKLAMADADSTSASASPSE